MAQQPKQELTPGQQEALDKFKDAKIRKLEEQAGAPTPQRPVNTIKKAKGGSVKSSASRRADGIAQRGKTKGRFV